MYVEGVNITSVFQWCIIIFGVVSLDVFQYLRKKINK